MKLVKIVHVNSKNDVEIKLRCEFQKQLGDFLDSLTDDSRAFVSAGSLLASEEMPVPAEDPAEENFAAFLQQFCDFFGAE